MIYLADEADTVRCSSNVFDCNKVSVMITKKFHQIMISSNDEHFLYTFSKQLYILEKFYFGILYLDIWIVTFFRETFHFLNLDRRIFFCGTIYTSIPGPRSNVSP